MHSRSHLGSLSCTIHPPNPTFYGQRATENVSGGESTSQAGGGCDDTVFTTQNTELPGNRRPRRPLHPSSRNVPVEKIPLTFKIPKATMRPISFPFLGRAWTSTSTDRQCHKSSPGKPREHGKTNQAREALAQATYSRRCPDPEIAMLTRRLSVETTSVA